MPGVFPLFRKCKGVVKGLWLTLAFQTVNIIEQSSSADFFLASFEGSCLLQHEQAKLVWVRGQGIKKWCIKLAIHLINSLAVN